MFKMIFKDRIRLNSNMNIKIFILFIFCFIVFCSYLYFLFPIGESAVEIEAIGEKSEASMGNGVQIIKIIKDNHIEKTADDFFEDTRWDLSEDERITWNDWSVMSNKVSKILKFKNLKINFLKDQYSGKARIYLNGEVVQELDLFSEDRGNKWVELSVNKYLDYYYMILMVIVFLCLMFILGKIYFKYKEDSKKSKTIYLESMIFGFLSSFLYFNFINTTYDIFIFLLNIVLVYFIFVIIYIEVLRGFLTYIYFKQEKVIPYIFSIIIVILITLSIGLSIEKNREIEEVIQIEKETEDLTVIELTEGVRLTQNINIDGRYDYVKFNVQSDNNTKGSIFITIEKSGKAMEKMISALNIRNKDTIVLDTKDLGEGEATLVLEGIEGTKGNSIKVFLSNSSQFGGCWVNHFGINKNLDMIIKTQKEKVFYKFQIWMFIVFIIILSIILIYIWREQYNDKVIFLLTTIAIFLSFCIRNPILYIDAQAFHESSSLFWIQTYDKGLLGSLFAPDFYYWPLFQRLISGLVTLASPLKEYNVIIMNITSCIFVAINCALINCKCFRLGIHKFTRLLISIILGISPILYTEDNVFYHNFPYWNVIFLVLALTLSWEKLNKKKYILLLMSTIMLISKIQFIILLPFYFTLLFILVYKKEVKENKRLFIYLLLSSIMLIISILYTKIMFGVEMNNIRRDFSYIRFLKIIKKSTYYFIQTFFNTWGYLGEKFNNNGYIILVLTIGVLLYVLTLAFRNVFYKKEGNEREIFLIFILIFSYVSVIFTIYFDYTDILHAISWETGMHLYIGRRELIAAIGIIFLIMFMIDFIFVSYKRNEVLDLKYFLVVGIFMINIFIQQKNIYTDHYTLSNCKIYARELDRKSYAIPVGGGDLFALKNAYVAYIGYDNKDRFRGEYNQVFSAKDLYITDSKKNISEIEFDEDNKEILEIYAVKGNILQDYESYAVLKDIRGKVITQISSIYTEDRGTVAYIIPDGIKGIKNIEFYYERDGTKYPLRPSIYIGMVGKYEEK